MLPPKTLMVILLIALFGHAYCQDASKIFSPIKTQPDSKVGIYGDLIVDNIPLSLDGEVHINTQASKLLNPSPTTIGIVEFNMNDQLQLETELIVLNEAKFNSGLVKTDLTNTLAYRLHFLENAISTGSNPGSYVDGAVSKSGSAEFTYPLGSEFEWVGLTTSASSDPNNQFMATYSSDDVSMVLSTDPQNCTKLYSTGGYWKLDRISGTEDVMVTINYLAGDLPSDEVCDNLIATWDGSKWLSEGNGGITGDNQTGGQLTSGTGCGTCGTNQAIQNYSYITIATPVTVTPVDFLSFTGEWIGKLDAELTWTVTNEKDNEFFVIEQSFNGLDWSEVEVVESLGDTQSERQYSSIQNNLLGSNRFYFRIKQIDFDGHEEYFDQIVLLQREQSDFVEVYTYPNPVREILYVEIPKEYMGSTIEVVNVLGQTVLQQKDCSQFETLNMHQYAVGLYVLKIIDPKTQQTIFEHKISKY